METATVKKTAHQHIDVCMIISAVLDVARRMQRVVELQMNGIGTPRRG
jgi:hypothetical protein